MPKKLHRGPPTRQSERLAKTTPSPDLSRLAKDMPEEPSKVCGTDYPAPTLPETSAEESITTSIEENDHPSQDEEDSAQGLRQATSASADTMDVNPLAATVAALQAELRAIRASSLQSVSESNASVPVGPASLPGFEPYDPAGTGSAINPNYDRKARKRAMDPGKFDGDKEEFDSWIVKMSDNLVGDAEIFKNERERMAAINACTEGLANDLLRGRYNPLSKNAFKNAREMVATLAAVYFDNTKATKARDKLRKMMYDPADKSTDIHQYISEIDSLADSANIIMEERKSTLLEHIPASLDPRLLNDSLDPEISYEKFTNLVSRAALSQQRAYQERRERKDKKEARASSPREKKPRRQQVEKTTTTTKAAATEGACFGCGKTGHRIRDCPEAKKIASIYKAMEKDGAFLPRDNKEPDDTQPPSPSHSSSSSSSRADTDESEN
jgi:hypothetical protein